MSNREGRGNPCRDHPSRSDEKSHHGRGNNPPSRHLWIGNLPYDLTERGLAHYFLRFGDLESVAFQPGRSYAFINYRNDEDAFAAIEELQGFVIGGNPLRIEFTKAEKSLIDADYSERRKEAHPMGRESSSFTDRDSRARRSSTESPYLNKSKSIGNKDSEPSEVLWIGFPAQLKIDEFILRKAFSPFGEIEKITAFPGRTYAFVRYRNVMAASRAKETLQGKLFGNPRVHICFAANNEYGTSERGRNSINAPPSPYVESHGRPGSSEHLRSDRNFRGVSRDHSTRSSPYLDHDVNPKLWRHGGNDYEERRFQGPQDSDIRSYERRNSPPRGMLLEFSPRQGPFYDDQWDLPEDVLLFHSKKELKSSDSFHQENELPDYPFSDLEQVKHVLPHSNLNSRPLGDRLTPGGLLNKGQQFGDRSDNWNAAIDNFQVAASPLPPPPPPDSRRESSSKVVWKWEGMIAKGGTPVCRARCFPVGKSMDMVLPNFIDCTARTSLEMLAEHYYNEAASAWVVFFVPADDADIGYYNEFMNILGGKHRAAVAKLDEWTTLFLVPPSEFSEKVLKVPGKLSLSGVILRLHPPHGSSQYDGQYEEKKETAFSQPYLPSFSHYENNTGISGNLPSATIMPPPVDSLGGHYSNNYLPKPPPAWDLQSSNPSTGNIASSTGHLHTHNNYYTPEIPLHGNDKRPVQEKPSSSSGGIIAVEQLAQLTSSLLRQQQQQQQGGGEYMPINQSSGYSSSSSTAVGSQNYYGLPNDHHQSATPAHHQQFGHMQQQQLQQSPNILVAAPQREVQAVAAQVSQQLQNAGQGDAAEADPQVRLQATLQLAATLLQQIQQQKGI